MSLLAQVRQTNWIGVFIDALRGRGGNPTDGPIVPAIIMLAVPMVL